VVPGCDSGDSAVICSEGCVCGSARALSLRRGEKQRQVLGSGPGAEETTRGLVQERAGKGDVTAWL